MFSQIVETNPEAFSSDYQTLLDAVNGFDAECQRYSALFEISLMDAAQMIRERNAETPLPMTGEELCAYFCDETPDELFDRCRSDFDDKVDFFSPIRH